jgi:hypothetical protein
MLKKLTLLFVALAAVFTFTACEEDITNPTTEEPTPEPISNFQATSIDSATIALKWTASVDEDDALFDGYYLTIEGIPGAEQKVEPLAEGQYLNVSDLNRATEYTFTLFAKYKNDSVSTPVSVTWAVADRFTMDDLDETLKVYEYASSMGSGLDLYSPTWGFPQILTVDGGAEWDLGLNTKTETIFGSAESLGFSITPEATTEICKDVIYTDDLNSVFDSEALSAKNFEVGTVNLDEMTGSFVMIVRRQNPETMEYNYAKVLVKYANGGYMQGDADDRYVELEVSYQKEEGIPYAETK